MKKRWIAWLGLFVFVAVIATELVGCGKKPPPPPPPPPKEEPPPPPPPTTTAASTAEAAHGGGALYSGDGHGAPKERVRRLFRL